MPRLALLESAETGWQAGDLDRKLREPAVGEEEAIRRTVKAYQRHLPGFSAVKQHWRVTLFVAIVVCGNLAGNVLLRAGVHRQPAAPSLSLVPYLQALLSPWVVAGVLLLMLALASQLTLLSWADLSYVAPMTSIGYVLTPLAGGLFLHEPLSSARSAAILLITAGVTLVSGTPASTARVDCCGGRQ